MQNIFTEQIVTQPLSNVETYGIQGVVDGLSELNETINLNQSVNVRVMRSSPGIDLSYHVMTQVLFEGNKVISDAIMQR